MSCKMESLISFIINKAKAESHDMQRDVAVFVDPSIFEIADKYFNRDASHPRNRCIFEKSEIILRKAIVSGEGLPHYQSVYVINNGNIGEDVLKELPMISGIKKNEPMLYSEINVSEKYGN